jgi:hypothetical protein
MLDEIVFLGEHSLAESALELLHLEMDFTDVLVVIANLREGLAAPMAAHKLLLFSVSPNVIVKLGQT